MDNLIELLKASARRRGREAYAAELPHEPPVALAPGMAAEYEAGWGEAFAADWETQ